MEEKIALPHLGGLLGETGVRENHISGRGFSWLAQLALFLLDHRRTCTVFLVFAMFAMTTMADSCTLTPYPRLQALRPVEQIFHCLSNV